MEDLCENVEENGKNDIAIMTLERKIDFSKLQHVKPACNYAVFGADIEVKSLLSKIEHLLIELGF